VELEERVQRGAQLLDEKYPGWADRIDLRSFSISSPWLCILGQLFGGYLEGVYSLNIVQQEALYGFNIKPTEPFSTFRQLQKLWQEAIEERRRQ
jgi:hypothetical protein